MKLEVIDDGELIIYLKKYKIYDIDFSNEKNLENILKNLFNKLNECYDIKIKGYYNIDIFLDKNYGCVLKMCKEELEYYDYFDNQVDMKIVIHNSTFLYEINDYFNINIKKFNVYRNLNNIYLLPKDKLNSGDLCVLMENAIIVYDSEEILKRSVKIK